MPPASIPSAISPNSSPSQDQPSIAHSTGAFHLSVRSCPLPESTRKGMGTAAGQVPAAGFSPHRRRPRRDPFHRHPAPSPRLRHGTPEQAAERARFDVALVAVLSDAGLRCSEAAAFTWDDGSGRITVVRVKTDVGAQGAVVAVTSAAVRPLDAIKPVGVDGRQRCSGCQNRR